MDTEKLSWCLRLKDGLRIKEPNEFVSIFDEIISSLNEKDIGAHRDNLKRTFNVHSSKEVRP